MRIILITILIYKKRFPAPEWKNEVKKQWRLRQSAKAKWKSEVCLSHAALSTGYPQVSARVSPALHPSIVARIFAFVKLFWK